MGGAPTRKVKLLAWLSEGAAASGKKESIKDRERNT